MNFNILRSKVGTLITNNPKTVVWSSVGTGIIGGITLSYWYLKNCVEHKHTLEQKDKDFAQKMQQLDKEADCDIRKASARTACEILKQATEIMPELKDIKSELKTVKDKIAEGARESPESPNNNSVEVQNLGGRDFSELFNRGNPHSIGWIVDGYMAVGIVNLFVACGGVGKSILVIQIALAVNKGIRPEFLPDNCISSVKLKVVYYRLEDFKGELEGKYGDGAIFAKAGITCYLPEDIKDFTVAGLTAHIKSLAGQITQDTLICIDPATKLSDYKHTSFIKGLEQAMSIAKQRGYTLTPIASIHLDEIKNWAPLSAGDIKNGDKGLQLAGSVTAMRRERTSDNYRYLQCLKAPKGFPTPFGGNALVMKSETLQIDKDNWYLYYVYNNIKPEVEARPQKPKAVDTPSTLDRVTAVPSAPNQKVTPKVGRKIEDMLRQNVKVSIIARKCNLSEKTIRRYKKDHIV